MPLPIVDISSLFSTLIPESGLLKAQTATRVLFGTDFSMTQASDITEALRGNPFLHFRDKSEVLDIPISKLAVQLNLSTSNGTFFFPPFRPYNCITV